MIGKVISVLISILITLIGIFGAWISIIINFDSSFTAG